MAQVPGQLRQNGARSLRIKPCVAATSVSALAAIAAPKRRANPARTTCDLRHSEPTGAALGSLHRNGTRVPKLGETQMTIVQRLFSYFAAVAVVSLVMAPVAAQAAQIIC